MLATVPRTRGDTWGSTPIISRCGNTAGGPGSKTNDGGTNFGAARVQFGTDFDPGIGLDIGDPLDRSGGGLPVEGEAEDWVGGWTSDGDSTQDSGNKTGDAGKLLESIGC